MTIREDDLARLSFRLEELDAAIKNLNEAIARVLGTGEGAARYTLNS